MKQTYHRIEVEDITGRLNREDWRIDTTGLHELPQTDMPGNVIKIEPGIIHNANQLFPEIIRQIKPLISKNPYQRVVLSVCGGSGVGKTSVAYLLSWYFRQIGIGSYTLSGDNYPHRIPKYNDAERLRIFREWGLRRMIEDGVHTKEHAALVQQWQEREEDADSSHLAEHPWFASYLAGARLGLENYLGTEQEQDFQAVSDIIAAFLDGAGEIWLRHMGRKEAEVWYECADFEKVHVLIVEWTHGNSDYFQGVDIPILLNSTPAETLEYRKARNRDKGTDSPFTTMVLEIEQEKLHRQARKAKLILSKNGELLTYDEYCRVMKESELKSE